MKRNRQRQDKKRAAKRMVREHRKHKAAVRRANTIITFERSRRNKTFGRSSGMLAAMAAAIHMANDGVMDVEIVPRSRK